MLTLDNEKKLGETMPDDSAEVFEEAADVPEEPHDGVVIENFDDEKDGDDELYERYVELMNQEDEEEDDIAAVAERITGERHSKVSTAAPLRIRDNSAQTAPQATSMPVRKPQVPVVPPVHPPITGEVPVHNKPDSREKLQAAAAGKQAKRKQTLTVVVASVLAFLIMVTSVVAVVNVVLNREEPELPEELPGSEEILPEELPSEDAVDTTEDPLPEETEPEEPVSEETEPETEEETVEEPEPAEPEQPIEPEPVVEPEPVPEYTVTLDFYDRDDITATVTQMTLAEVYAAVGYTPRESDRPAVGMDYVISSDDWITIGTAEYKNVSVKETIPYGTDVIEVDTIPRGEKNYISAGENGEMTRVYTVEYINGVEQNRTFAYEEVTKWAVNEKYELGVGGSFTNAHGITYTYSYRRTVPATYYNLEGLTYLGTMADESVIAVDPNNIPLGTKVYVKNDTYDFGVRVASDTGPKVEEWQIDIWLSPYNPQFASFAQTGYHYDMEIYYLD